MVSAPSLNLHPEAKPQPTERNTAFDNAYKSFYECLPDKDQMLFAPCASSEDLLDGLKKLGSLAKHHDKESFLSRISNFATSLQPYLNIVDIMVSSNPQYTALVWGALRFVFQIASNFSTFFEKLLNLLANLSKTFPQYERIGKFCTENPTFTTDLRRYVEQLYEDLFQLFLAVAKIFTSGERKLKRTSAVIGSLLWKPFDIRFQDFVQRFSNHRDLIQLEIGLVQARTSQALQDIDIIVRQEQLLNSAARSAIECLKIISSEGEERRIRELKDSIHDQFRNWLSPLPLSYEEPFHRSRELHENDTNGWIFLSPEFSAWARNEWKTRPSVRKRKLGANSLWIQGKPGCGKTVLASSIIQGLHNDALLLPRKMDVYYYFFDSQNSEVSVTATSAYRSILTQILHHRKHEEAMIDKFAFWRTSQSEGSTIASSAQLSELIKICLSSFDCFLVLDAIDECQDNERLMDLILWLSENSTTKVVLLSRPNVTSLVRTVPKKGRFMISKETTQKDMQKYLKTQINLLVEDDYFPPDTIAENIVHCLLKGADGMFLWAKLMIGYLKSPAHTSLRRLQEVSAIILPEELAKMYRRIMALIENSDHAQRKLAQSAIEWTVYSMTPLTLNQLHEALVFDEGKPSAGTSNKFKDFEDTISIVTGGLVEVNLPTNADVAENGTFVRLIHSTATDFFQSNSLHNHDLIPARSISNLRICRTCVGCILREAPKTRPETILRGDVSVPKPIETLATYATRSWVHHFGRTFGEEPVLEVLGHAAFSLDFKHLLEVVSSFLTQPLAVTSWLELLYRLGNDQKGNGARFLQLRVPSGLTQLANLGVSDLSQEASKLGSILATFTEELLLLEKDWGEKLLHSPEILWDEASVFRKLSFLAGDPKTQVRSMVPKKLEHGSASSDALSCISQTGRIQCLGTATAVLSIWPSVSFKKAWQEKQPVCYQDCSGWVAHYELWHHGGNSDRIVDFRMPLDANEIWIQLQQSLRRWGGELQTSFPLTIGESLLCFTVLRTVFKVKLGEKGTDARMKFALVAMNFLEEVNRFWSITDRENSWFYTYTFRISIDDCRLFFSDSASNTVHGEIYSSHIAVFEIEMGDELRVKLQTAGPVDDLDLLQKVLFHPNLSVVTLTYPHGVKLWDYKHKTSTMKFLWKRERRMWWNGDMSFSACGKFVLIAGQQEGIPLPDQHLSELFDCSNSFGDQGERVPLSGAPASFGSTKSRGAPFTFQSGQIISSTSTRTVSQEMGTGTILVGDVGSITLSLADASGKKVSGLHLLSIPRWNQSQETAQTIIVPEKNSTAFTIVMERGSEKAYSLDKKEEEHFPLVVKREVSDIYQEEEEEVGGTKRARNTIMSVDKGKRKCGGAR